MPAGRMRPPWHRAPPCVRLWQCVPLHRLVQFISQRHQQRLVRYFNKFNSENFNDDLFSKIKNFVPKFNTVTGKNISDLFEQFYSLITKTIDTHAPLKKLSRKQRRLKSKPWITKGLLISIKRKQKLHKLHFMDLR